MKKILFALLGLALFTLPSCIIEEGTGRTDATSFNLNVEVADIGTGVEAATRASVPATNDEVVVNSLYLLFYRQTGDGSGAFVDCIKVENPVMSTSIPISFGGTNLSNTESYSILALANVEDYIPGSIETFLGDLETKTEKLAMEQATIEVGSDPGTSATDYTTRRIPASRIPMSAKAAKAGGDMEVTVKLTRGVSRFDVYNNQDAGYEMVSVSIWGASTSTPLWFDKMTDTPDRSQRFYGITTNGNVEGGLYAFENFVSDPKQGDEKTTCLIIGIKPRAGSSVGTPGTTYYYRVNVHPEESSQNLKRNYVYKVTIRNIYQEGYDSEYNAWKGADNRLGFTINNWNLDDEGLVLTDGVSTLVVPVKRVRLDPDGDAREYSVYTLGVGTLTMSKSEMPSGIDVSLNGNLLKVTATPLSTGTSERKGSIELSFGSLRGTIDFIQTREEDAYLTLNKYNLGVFPSQASASSDWIIVNSSGPWTAKIYNTGSGTNPGFSFESNQPVKTELTLAGNGNSNQFRLYTTGENPTNETRHSFIVVSLDGYEDISRAVVLTQRGLTNLTLTPYRDEMVFSPTGIPENIANAIAGDPFVFTVNAGSTDGAVNSWDAELTGPHAAYFTLVKSQGYEQKIEIRAKGCTAPPALDATGLSNLSGDALVSGVRVWLTGGEFAGTAGSEVEIEITHLPLGIGLSQVSDVSTVPVTGTYKNSSNAWVDYVEYSIVDLTPGLTWKAFIDKVYVNGVEVAVDESNAFFVDAAGNRQSSLNDMAHDQNLVIGFDKIHYPFVNKTPSVQVRVEASNSSKIYTLKTVSQTALTAKPVRVLDVVNTSNPYGSVTYTGGTSYFGAYRLFLMNAKLFGTTGSVRTKDASPAFTGFAYRGYIYSAANAIPDTYSYVHMSGREDDQYTTAIYQSTENWRMGNDGVMVWPIDAASKQTDPAFTLSYVFGKAGYVHLEPAGNSTNTNSCKLNTDTGSRIMQYLLQDGPFTNGGTPVSTSITFYRDGASNGVTKASLPEGAVSVIENTGNNNGNGSCMLVIDPNNKLVFIGESQMFSSYTTGYSSYSSIPTLSAPVTDHDKFLCNLLAYVVNAAMYGSHFTDLFVDGTLAYPFESGFVAPNP